jgi:tRNA dimethylallyltransferase
MKLLVIAGPTASGKTALALSLAQQINGEILSADSMQVYRGMDIGTAKPTMDERQGIPHHLMDIVNPDEPFSAADFQRRAAAVVAEIHQRGHVPILTGGTGFYINALLYGNDFVPIAGDQEMAYRQQLSALAVEKGALHLHDLLREADPDAAAVIHPNNVKRVIRAVSFYRATGLRISEHNAQQRQNKPAYDAFFVVLQCERTVLWECIRQRTKHMLAQGLLDEVRGLQEAGYHGGLASMQSIGYKEALRFLQGNGTLLEMEEDINTATRQYAKRQMTWFRQRCPAEARWMAVDGKTKERILSWLNISRTLY